MVDWKVCQWVVRLDEIQAEYLVVLMDASKVEIRAATLDLRTVERWAAELVERMEFGRVGWSVAC